MAENRQERHRALRIKLVDIAERRIIEGGIPNVKARDLARQADCALGAIYTVFDDLNHIILEVNARSFRQLGQQVRDALGAQADAGAADQLIAVAGAYLDFALTQTHRWRSLFDFPFSEKLDVPQWYWDELDRLFAHIAGPVADSFPSLTNEDQALMVRALFSSVHGIVSFGIENRVTPVPKEQMTRMIALIIRQITGNA